MTQLALQGVRVISVGHTLPGLYCLAILRDLGADVTRIERPAVHQARFAGIAGQFPVRSLQAGTSVCVIDLKAERGATVFRRLARQADVVLEGFRPGVAARLGIDQATLAAENPRLLHIAISGYGQEGPWRDRVGHDVNYLAATGALGLCGDPGARPSLPGLTYADGLTGVSAALNVLAALRVREQEGSGAALDLAITDSPVFLMSSELEHHWDTGTSRARGDTHLTGAFAWYGTVETKDGHSLALGAVERPFFERICRLIGRPDFADRQLDTSLDAQLRAVFKSRTRDEWLALLADEDTCVSPVLSTAEAAEAPPVARVLRKSEAQHLVRSPIRLPPAPLPPPRDTAATLSAFGFTDDEIRALQDERVVPS
jgi:crotonobetainyl-CoA:carnitine CoA-transferase CaiB-like acyl-CoA transferase